MKRERNRRATRRRHTIRRRILAILVFVCISGFIGYYDGFHTSAHAESVDEATIEQICYKSIIIQPGDSLWSIAEEYMPEDYQSIESYIADIKKLNSLTSDEIHANQHLLIAYNTML